jgi:AAA domain/Toprim-like
VFPSLQEIARAVGGEIRGGQVLAPGPGHSAEDRSLSITLSESPPGYVVYSFAGDDAIECKDYVRAKLGQPQWKPNGGSGRDPIIADYVYRTADGKPYLRVQRTASKKFWQQHADGDKWLNGAPNGPRVLYRLPELLAADPATPIYVVEGEKDADRLASLGFVATTTSGGSNSKWTPELAEPLAGKTVYIIPDNDEPGEKYAQQAAQQIHAVAAKVAIAELPGLGPRTPDHGKDVSDWLDLGNLPENITFAAENAPEWSPSVVSNKSTGPRLMTSAAFVQGFTPPDYLIVGILQRRFIYAITGRTGEGKTAVCLRLAAHVAEGIPLNDHTVMRGRVLYLAGENPDDIRMRWIVLMEQMGLDANNVAVDFVDGRFNISEIPGHILAAATEHEYVLVIVDTSVAFSQSIDENDNVQQLRHAQALRGLIDMLAGGPAILVCCHPPKNAGDDNLQPRGGGAVIAEFDGNLTCRRTETVTELHHQGKFRGPDFAPKHFMLQGATTARLKDSNGNLIWTVFAKPASEQDQEEISKAVDAELIEIMKALTDGPSLSLAGIAQAVGWRNPQGQPNKSKVQRRVRLLERKKLVERDGERLEITSKGKKWLAKRKEAAQEGGPDLHLVRS